MSISRDVSTFSSKQSACSTLCGWLIKKMSSLRVPNLTKIFNKSILLSKVPPVFKSCYVTPLIKKSILDPSGVCSYRPISNLSDFSKLLERLVLCRVMDHLNRHNFLPQHQSASSQHHSTETAVLRVSLDLLSVAGAGQMSLLVPLDLSAVFDTVDHDILLGRLETSFGFMCCAVSWFRSYLADRSFSADCGELASSFTSITCGSSQGSVLTHSFSRMKLRTSFGHKDSNAICTLMTRHGHCRDQTECLSVRISNCVEAISDWMFSPSSPIERQ